MAELPLRLWSARLVAEMCASRVRLLELGDGGEEYAVALSEFGLVTAVMVSKKNYSGGINNLLFSSTFFSSALYYHLPFFFFFPLAGCKASIERETARACCYLESAAGRIASSRLVEVKKWWTRMEAGGCGRWHVEVHDCCRRT